MTTDTGVESALADGALVFLQAFASALTPPPSLKPSTWAEENFIVPEGPYAGMRWLAETAPYLTEILDCLGPDDPCNTVTVRKSAQVGLTLVGIIWAAYIAACTPGPMMKVLPTEDLARRYNREKLSPAIQQNATMRRAIAPSTTRSADGSNVLFKQFLQAGFLALVGANSAAGLRSRTVQYMDADEIDEWPLDLEGQGDPMQMADARKGAYEASGLWKKGQYSTPTIEGQSRIDKAYLAGDQREWHMPCPLCGTYQQLVFENLRYSETYPHNTRYECAHCGDSFGHEHKHAMLRQGRWIAQQPGPGREPSFHIDALSSPFTTWDNVVAQYLEVKDDPQQLKGFTNLRLGRSFKVAGEAPDAERLYNANRTFTASETLPPGVLFLTFGADVQADRIEYEVLGHGVGGTTWSIEYTVLPGNTAELPIWVELRQRINRQWLDQNGVARGIEVGGIDAGFRRDMVAAFTAPLKGRIFALVGAHGPQAPIIGTQQKMIAKPGRAAKRSIKSPVFPVGVWHLKAAFYARLNLSPHEAGFPPGFCHFRDDLDLQHFKQLTSERLVERQSRGGQVTLAWERIPNLRNEQLDVGVYARAAADHPWMVQRGLRPVSQMTPAAWEALAAARGAEVPAGQLDLMHQAFGPKKAPVGKEGEHAHTKPTPQAQKPSGGGLSAAEQLALLNRRR